jgi:hypothetical protein
MSKRQLGLAFAIALFSHALSVGASYVFTYPTIPGGTLTEMWGINDNGMVAANGVLGSGPNMVQFAGVFTSGTLNPLPLPPAGLGVGAVGINNAGAVVGVAYQLQTFSPEQGFILTGGQYTLFSHPGYSDTEARAISPSGLVTGSAINNPQSATPVYTGYIYDPATHSFTDIFPGSAGLVIAQGINSASQVVGSVHGANGTSGTSAFLRQPDGTISVFQINNAFTAARGINDNGLIAGFTAVGSVTEGFVGDANGFQLLAVPGATSTVIEGLNNLGQVSGIYDDAAGNEHAFYATPAQLPVNPPPPPGGSFVFDAAVVAGVPIFIDPLIATGYDYAVGAGDPLFASVRLPFGIGDSQYTLIVNGMSFDLGAGDLFDFTQLFPGGVSAFRVTGIELDAMLDPANVQAFPTELTFAASGRFTGTQTPITAQVPEPATVALFGIGLAGFAWSRRRSAPAGSWRGDYNR